LLGIGAPTKVEMSGSIILEQITGMKVL
jgi:hypothetical protein